MSQSYVMQKDWGKAQLGNASQFLFSSNYWIQNLNNNCNLAKPNISIQM
jgi:hypothetical protein